MFDHRERNIYTRRQKQYLQCAPTTTTTTTTDLGAISNDIERDSSNKNEKTGTYKLKEIVFDVK